MSLIPPNWLGSIAGSSGAQQRAAAGKAAEAAGAAGGGTFADKLTDVIEASDRDSQVYADAEGAGSQGRPEDQGAPADHAPDAEREDGAGGLDISA